MLRADTGIIRVNGSPVRLTKPLDAIMAGIGMVHQHFTLVPTMTVAENLALGGRGRLSARAMEAEAREIAERLGFSLDPAAIAGELSVGAQQRVEIAKALSHDARVLVLDEPTAVLAPAEIDELLRWLRQYVASGNAAVLITHKLREALAIADDVTVLRRSRVVVSSPVGDVTVESLTSAMIGTTGTAPRHEHSTREPGDSPSVLRADRISVVDPEGRVRITDASFVIRSGELVGVAAVEGAGQRELLRALAGRRKVIAGTLSRPAHVGFVPEDRHRDAGLLDRSLTENVALAGAGIRRGRIDWRALQSRTMTLMDQFDVRAAGPSAALRELSGGNQQKLVLARELSSSEDAQHALLVVENPTRGLDVRATAAVHEHLRDACAKGGAVVMYSSDLDEMLSLASRVLVVFSGHVHEEAMDRERIGRAMLGLSSER
jgi:simple sugar transport system ATP-binding protein